MLKIVQLAAAGLALAAMASAQSLALGPTPGNNGNVGGGIYFNLTVNQTLTLNSIAYQCKNDGAAGPYMSSFDMFVGPGTYVGNVGANPGPWVQVASTTPVSITGGTGVGGSGATQLVTGVLNPAGLNTGTITFLPGTYGIALRAVNHQWRYQNFTALQTFSNADLSVVAGAASNGFLALPTFSPRVICGSINYTLGGSPMQFAQREPYGKGCYGFYRSFYELWPSSTTVDMSNKSLYLTLVGNTYVATQGTTPVDTASVTSANLNHPDDGAIVITLANSQPIIYPAANGPAIALTTVEMSSEGYVTLNGSNPATTFNPTVTAFLTGNPRIGNWHDMDPTGLSITGGVAGSTHYDFDAVHGAHLFTWLACIDSGILNAPNTFQMAFFANGDVEMRWGTMSQAGGGQWPTLIGFSPGTGALDPGIMDISATPSFSTSSIDQSPLGLTGNTNPVLNTNVQLTTSKSGNLAPGLGLCFVTLSDLPPFSPVGLDLAIVGAPGCVANVDINQGAGYVISDLGLPGYSMTVPFAIPAGPTSIIGLSFYCQSVWLDATQNAGGLITSNALRLKVGAF